MRHYGPPVEDERMARPRSAFLDTNLELFKEFCMKLLELGVLLDRSWLHIRALHPPICGDGAALDAGDWH
jgi:hypothetical protein